MISFGDDYFTSDMLHFRKKNNAFKVTRFGLRTHYLNRRIEAGTKEFVASSKIS